MECGSALSILFLFLMGVWIFEAPAKCLLCLGALQVDGAVVVMKLVGCSWSSQCFLIGTLANLFGLLKKKKT